MQEKQFFIYIMANERPTLYTGVTNDLKRRVYEHQHKINPNSFTARYELDKLIFFEICSDSMTAIAREKQIKNMDRKKKMHLIKTFNPTFKDLSGEI